ncbi:hypothetical protein SPHG1_10 [Salmonella phage SPHG1]|nr:hypothetical protein SPHG1_10 [Salmonella phage SPHG1]
MTTVFDRSGKAHEALGFVICVDEGSTSLLCRPAHLTQGKVYANLGSFGGAYDNLWVIDDRGLKQNFSVDRFAKYESEKHNWGIARRSYSNLKEGKLYRVEKNRPGVRSLDGTNQIACLDETGNWLTYNEDVFRLCRPAHSEQYMVAKLKAAAPVKNTAINFKVEEEIADDKLKFVGVKFEPNGRVYTYKYIGKVSVGDKAVVDVRNVNYPELNGTKLVDVVSVSAANTSGYNLCRPAHTATLKWLVDVPDFNKYQRRQQVEDLLREASARLDLEVEKELERRRQSVVALDGIAALKAELL